MRTFAIGDIHGNFAALQSVLYNCPIDYNDHLIILGDVVDGHYQTYECVEELLKFNNRTFILGNHDQWFIQWYKKDWMENIWTMQGGEQTMQSYLEHQIREKVKQTHRDFFNNHKIYHEQENMLFVHGGLGKSDSPRFCDTDTMLWDREMVYLAKERKIGSYDKIFVGHTTTQIFGSTKPQVHNNVIILDTGAGGDGKLTIMDIYSNEYWQND